MVVIVDCCIPALRQCGALYIPVWQAIGMGLVAMRGWMAMAMAVEHSCTKYSELYWCAARLLEGYINV